MPVLQRPIGLTSWAAGQNKTFYFANDTFADLNTPTNQLMLSGNVTLAAGGELGGALGLTFVAGPQGAAAISGRPTLIGGGIARVALAATNLLSHSTVHAFEVAIVDMPPVVDLPLPNQVAYLGKVVHIAIPAATFRDSWDLTPVPHLMVNGTVRVVAGASRGATTGLSVTPGAPGAALVSGIVSAALPPGTELRVELTCTDQAGGTVEHGFALELLCASRASAMLSHALVSHAFVA